MIHKFTIQSKKVAYNEGTGYYDSGNYTEQTLVCSCGYREVINDYYKDAESMKREHKDDVISKALGLVFEDG